MNFLKYPNRKGDKIYFHYDYGRGKGQRPSTGIFIYAEPKDQIQKNHNKEALALLEVKKRQATIEQQAIGSSFIPAHKFKANFLEYLLQAMLFFLVILYVISNALIPIQKQL